MRPLIVPLALLVLSTVAGYADRATPDPTKTQMALPLETPPIIDGIIDTAEWERAGGAAGNFWLITPDPNLTDGIKGGALGDNAGSLPASSADLSFYVYAGYDSTDLYVAVHVNDDLLMNDDAVEDSANGNTWMDDGVELFIDGDNSNFETRDTTGTNPAVVATGGQYVITANNAYREAEAGNPGYGESAAWFAKAFPRADGLGYDAEFRISLATLGNPKPGDIIGFTVGVGDDDDGTDAERQVVWVGTPHTEATYGNLRLGVLAYEAPKATAPTIDGTINAAEYSGAQEIKVEPHTAIWDLSAGDDAWEASDSSFSAWAIHDDDAVYVAVDVTDDILVNDSAEAGTEDGTTWEDDSVEIFFDADLARELTHSATLLYEGQYVFTANGAWRDNEALNPTFGADADWFAATKTKTANGYQVEFKVKKTALNNVADGAIMGFQIAINDDDGAGRKSQPGWSGRAHSEFTYGTLELGGSSAPPSLSIGRAGAEVTITYTGTLQSADTVVAVFTDVTGATSPYKPTTGPAKFYRSRQ